MDGNRDCPDCDGASADADSGKGAGPDVAKDDSDEEGDEGGSEQDSGTLHHDDGQDDDTDSDADAMDKAAMEVICAKYSWTPEQMAQTPTPRPWTLLVAAEGRDAGHGQEAAEGPVPQVREEDEAVREVLRQVRRGDDGGEGLQAHPRRPRRGSGGGRDPARTGAPGAGRPRVRGVRA